MSEIGNPQVRLASEGAKLRLGARTSPPCSESREGQAGEGGLAEGVRGAGVSANAAEKLGEGDHVTGASSLGASSPAGHSAALATLINELDAGRIRVYRDVLGKPNIEFRLGGHPNGAFSLFDDDVRAWLMDFFWHAGVGLLRKGQLDPILTYLAGRSLRFPCYEVDDPTLLKALQTEPVLTVAVEFMHLHPTGKYEQPMEALWKGWRDFAEDRNLLTFGKKKFPGGANVLSRQLRRLAPVLRALGLTVDIRRSNGSKVIITRRSDDTPAESPAQPSAGNTSPAIGLRHEDDWNARIAHLQERRTRQSQQEGV